VLAEELLSGELEVVTRKLIELAKGGDVGALRLVIERVLPRRGRLVEFDLVAVEKASDLVRACSAILSATASGELSLEEARGFMGLVDQERRAIETADLAARIEALEASGAADPDELDVLRGRMERDKS
jgi:hypothetical protein